MFDKGLWSLSNLPSSTNDDAIYIPPSAQEITQTQIWWLHFAISITPSSSPLFFFLVFFCVIFPAFVQTTCMGTLFHVFFILMACLLALGVLRNIWVGQHARGWNARPCIGYLPFILLLWPHIGGFYCSEKDMLSKSTYTVESPILYLQYWDS